jgi:DNA-3-methyladenine glycosylase II
MAGEDMIDAKKKKTAPDWTLAEQHLSACDPVLAEIIQRVGPCTLAPRRDYFAALCQAIVNQQISTAAARAVWARFRALFTRQKVSPAELLLLDDQTMRSAGISRQKAGYLRSLAEAFASGAVSPRKLCRMDDEAVVQALIPIKGIGRWTAEMFLIFVLNRTDLLPVDDLGLCTQVQRGFKLRQYPNARKLQRLAEKWRPYRSIATWYLWRGAWKQ